MNNFLSVYQLLQPQEGLPTHHLPQPSNGHRFEATNHASLPLNAGRRSRFEATTASLPTNVGRRFEASIVPPPNGGQRLATSVTSNETFYSAPERQRSLSGSFSASASLLDVRQGKISVSARFRSRETGPGLTRVRSEPEISDATGPGDISRFVPSATAAGSSASSSSSLVPPAQVLVEVHAQPQEAPRLVPAAQPVDLPTDASDYIIDIAPAPAGISPDAAVQSEQAEANDPDPDLGQAATDGLDTEVKADSGHEAEGAGQAEVAGQDEATGQGEAAGQAQGARQDKAEVGQDGGAGEAQGADQDAAKEEDAERVGEDGKAVGQDAKEAGQDEASSQDDAPSQDKTPAQPPENEAPAEAKLFGQDDAAAETPIQDVDGQVDGAGEADGDGEPEAPRQVPATAPERGQLEATTPGTVQPKPATDQSDGAQAGASGLHQPLPTASAPPRQAQHAPSAAAQPQPGVSGLRQAPASVRPCQAQGEASVAGQPQPGVSGVRPAVARASSGPRRGATAAPGVFGVGQPQSGASGAPQPDATSARVARVRPPQAGASTAPQPGATGAGSNPDPENSDQEDVTPSAPKKRRVMKRRKCRKRKSPYVMSSDSNTSLDEDDDEHEFPTRFSPRNKRGYRF